MPGLIEVDIIQCVTSYIFDDIDKTLKKANTLTFNQIGRKANRET